MRKRTNQTDTPTSAPAPAIPDSPTLTVDAATFKKFEDAYSGDRIPDGKLRAVVEHEGFAYTVTASGAGSCDARILHSANAWTFGKPTTYADRKREWDKLPSDQRKDFYYGIRAKHRFTEYVIGRKVVVKADAARPRPEPEQKKPEPDLGPAFTKDGTTYRLAPGVELDKLKKVHPTKFPGKPILPPVPRPRNETPEQCVGRLHTLFEKIAARWEDSDRERIRRALGADAGDGFIVRATDGFRALTVPGTPTADTKPTKVATLYDHYVILTPAFQLALKRVGTCADEKKLVVQITVDAQKRRVRLSARDHTVEGTEWVPTWGPLTKAVLAVNWRYLEDGLGVWPAFLYYSPKGDRIVLTDADDTFRYPLMLCRMS